jgi:hypothetical protein
MRTLIIILSVVLGLGTAQANEFYHEKIDDSWVVIGLKFPNTQPFCFAGSYTRDGGKFMLIKTPDDLIIRITPTQAISDDDNDLNFTFNDLNSELVDVEISVEYEIVKNTIKIPHLLEDQNLIYNQIKNSQTILFFLGDSDDTTRHIYVDLDQNGTSIINELNNCVQHTP